MSGVILTILCVGLPFAAIPILIVFRNKPNYRETTSIITSTLMCVCASLIVRDVLSGNEPKVILWDTLPNIPLKLHVEPIGALFAAIGSFLWLMTTIYSIGYMRANLENNQTRFYICFCLALGCTGGIAYAGNIFTLFLFYEALTLSTYPLVIHSGTNDAKRSGRIYLGILLSTSIMLLLLAMLWTWVEIGSLDFVKGGLLTNQVSTGTATILFILYIFGVGKAAIMPFHRWLPAAMVAPAPVSALLHAVAVVKAGVFTIIKISVYVFGLETITKSISGDWLIYVAGLTILSAAIIALRQDNLKLRLAYSTIGQLAYIVLAAALANSHALAAGTVHIAAHAFGKITLFFCAGAIYTATGRTKVSELSGIGRKMPITMGAFIVGALVMIGLPPSGGFTSKWLLLNATILSENWFALAVVIVGTMLTAAYLIPIIFIAFQKEDKTSNIKIIKEQPNSFIYSITISGALVITALASIGVFFYPSIALKLVEMASGI